MAIRIGFVGLAQAGKTTAAEYVAKQTGALMLSWAEPLKLEVFQFLQNWNINQFFTIQSDALGKMPIPYALPLPPQQTYDWENSDRIEWINANKKWLRPMLQWWGTEYRRGQNENYWAEQGAKFIDCRGPQVNIVSDDARFNNESDVMKERGFKICQIDRPGIAQMEHASEQLEIKPHYHLLNDGTKEDLYRSLDIVIGAYAR